MVDENCLIIPGSHRLAFLSKVLIPWKFPEPKGRAWLKRSIEEMGTLENFLPELYTREVERSTSEPPARLRAEMSTSRRIADWLPVRPC